MSRSVFSLILVLFLLTASAPLTAQTMSGHTAGQFQVNESGAAIYNIPITVPPGTAGIEPKLALSYSSQGRNSLLGMGWSLSGLSVISRCPATLAQDGFADGVDFDSSDRLCLDGERLMAIGGVYGANATEYRTEQDTFRRVISYGQAADGPAQITAWTKSGLTFAYANSIDSRIEAQGKPSVLFWAVNRINDSKGNYLDITYQEDSTNGQYRPVRIDYTGNDTASLAPYNSVQFIYEDRPDVVSRFVGGSLLKTTKRLKTIQAFEGAQLYREYRLTYEIETVVGFSRLTSLTECGSDGTCFAPTTFGWQPSTADNLSFNGAGSGMWQGHGGGVSENVLGDFDGDGMTDIAAAVAGRLSWDVRLSTGSAGAGGFGPFLDWSGHLGGTANNVTGDFNGDGRTDVASFTGANNVWNVCLSNGTDFECDSSNWLAHGGGISENVAGDFNGDGMTDIAAAAPGRQNWHVCLSTGSGFACDFWTSHASGAGNNTTGDFNGDGMTDVATTVAGTDWKVCLSTGIDFECSIWSAHGGGIPYNITADFNGDGLSDLAVAPVFTTDFFIHLSTGSGFAPHLQWPSHGGGIHYNITADFNGDGKADVAAVPIPNINWDVRLSTGSTFAHNAGGWPSHHGKIHNNILGDFNGDGRTDAATFTGTGGLWEVRLSGAASTNRLNSITTGHGHTTSITYKPLTDSAVYTKDTGSVYPKQDFQGAMNVVASYATSNGVGGASSFSYRYAGATVNRHGRGFRGFENTTITDHQTGITTTIFYERDHRCISSKVRRTEQRQPDGTLINEVDNTIAIDSPYGFGVNFSYVSQSVAKSYELDGNLVATVTTLTDYDDSGNVLSLSIDYGEGHTETTTNTYFNDFSNWYLGRLLTTEVTKTAPGQPTLTRTSAFEHNPVSGLLTKEIIEPDDPLLRLEKEYQHDPFGNITVSTTSGPDITSRSHTTVYDGDGRYVVQSINALGHSETKSYLLGNLETLTGPNLLSTSWEYDGFGRQTSEIRADGTATLNLYQLCNVTCPSGAVYSLRSDTTGAPTSIAYFDVLDREIRRETQGFDGTPIYVDTQHNALGQVDRVSAPYFAGDTPLWTSFTYNLVGRVLTETAPGSRTTATTYAGRTSIVTNTLGQTSSRTVNARGQLIASTDNASETVSYAYDAFGNMVAMTDPMGNITTLAYDTRGNKISIVDPDTGTTTFVYNSLGELISQTDANSNTVAITYDLLGRITTRSEPEGTSSWRYDTRSDGIGKLTRVKRGEYIHKKFYDTLGRPKKTVIRIAGQNHSFRTSYDLFSRPETLTYPTGFAVKTVYNTLGFESELRRVSDNQILWQANAVNARGQLEQATLGNGLVTTTTYGFDTGRIRTVQTGNIQDLNFRYDRLGNFIGRNDLLRGLDESFTYDGLNRLTSSQVVGQTGVTLAYDALGNITFKSDVGTYTYGENGAGPHAVTSITGAKANSYGYDAGGNRITSSAGSVAYTSFNKPRTITEGSTTLAFDYGPEYGRYRQVATIAGTSTTKLYIGGLLERETADTLTKDIHYIRAGGQTIAVYTVEDTGTLSVQTTRYLHRDHLGSVQTISDESGALIEVLSFDPWGLRREADDWSPATTSVLPTLDRGFTGHEHLDEVSLIHMNGRVYDPVIGRFLSADPFVQAPEYSQSLNRYSYVLNNPLSLTDPSGFFFKSLFRGIRHAISSTVSFVEDHGYQIAQFAAIATGNGWIIAGTNAAISFHAGIQSGAGFGDALLAGIKSGAISAATLYAPGLGSPSLPLTVRIIAHGVIQGTARAAQGGSFEHGFIAGAIGEIGLSAGGVIGGVIAAGTAEELGGGKFTNGALSAAMSYAAGNIGQAIRSEASGDQSSPDTTVNEGIEAGGVVSEDWYDAIIYGFKGFAKYLDRQFPNPPPPEHDGIDDVCLVCWLPALKGPQISAKLAFSAKNIQIDGPLGQRIFGVRYKKQPVFRLDYGSYAATKGQNRLHLHLDRIFPRKHISVDPRSLLRNRR